MFADGKADRNVCSLGEAQSDLELVTLLPSQFYRPPTQFRCKFLCCLLLGVDCAPWASHCGVLLMSVICIGRLREGVEAAWVIE